YVPWQRFTLVSRRPGQFNVPYRSYFLPQQCAQDLLDLGRLDVHGFVVGKARVLNETDPALRRILVRGTVAAIKVGTGRDVNRLADQFIQLDGRGSSGLDCAEENQHGTQSVLGQTLRFRGGHGAPFPKRPSSQRLSDGKMVASAGRRSRHGP